MKKSLVTAFLLFSFVLTGATSDESYIHHENALTAGADAPLFTLPNGSQEMISLETILEDGPALVFFYRGNWCPFCNAAMKNLAEGMEEISATGVTVIAISAQKLEYSAEANETYSGAFHILSDIDQSVAEAFGLKFSIDEETQALYKSYNIDLEKVNASETWELPVPGYFLIDSEGMIRWAYANEDYKVRPDAEMVLAEIAKITQ